jgi:glycosyltransferase involved in cell wall biosynthesis
MLDASVLICTFNRAGLLGEALDSLAEVGRCSSRRWELVIVDNNSNDETRATVERRQGTFPVPLRYLFEPRQGKSRALNVGIAACEGRVVVFGDDDQRFDVHWVDEACAPLDADPALSYTGGPVEPLWDAPPPAWMDIRHAELLGPPGLFDYGPDPFVFESRGRIAPGGNMAVRRAVFDRVGGFAVNFGRTGTSLLGQEQAEFFHRTRAAGATGLYVPSMIVFHHVPPERLTKGYFRRWWYWRGVSRARFDATHPIHDDVDLTRVRRLFGVPRYMFADALHDARCWAAATIRRDPVMPLVAELRLAYAAGYWREIHRRSETPTPHATHSDTGVSRDQRDARPVVPAVHRHALAVREANGVAGAQGVSHDHL